MYNQASLPLYIRFGEIPETYESSAHQGDALLRKEGGVSVYRAIESNNKYYPLLPNQPTESTISTYFSMLLESDRPVFLVIGDELPIEGADREPLLTNIKIIKDITAYYRNNKNDNPVIDMTE